MKTSLISFLTSNPGRLLLIDATGAILSAWMLGIVLFKYADLIGLPQPILFDLAAIAFVFAIFSLSSYFLSQRPGLCLLIIALANSFYCMATLIIMLLNIRTLTWMGYLYFMLEILIVAIIIKAEFRASKNLW